jgi:hypothetical protein
MDYGLWITDDGLWIMDYGLWIMDDGLWIMDYGLWIMDTHDLCSVPAELTGPFACRQ